MGAALFIAMSGRCGMCLLDDPLTLIVECGVASSKISITIARAIAVRFRRKAKNQ